jgi:hypothetical protein
MMNIRLATVLAEVTRLAPEMHKAGTFSPTTLEAIVRHAALRPITQSIETGAGASTLLFSHLSQAHTVFAIDAGTGSIRSVQESSLLRPGTVTFVEGPTQRTLPAHVFTQPLQLALIDGPHGYPFPDLEYYYIYPHLERDALLILDDIHIPTIGNLCDVLEADEMFTLQEVVETTAFFRRTDAPTFDPTGDGWWLQQYNKRAFEPMPIEPVRGALPRLNTVPTPFHVEQFGACQNPTGQEILQIACNEALVISGWALDGAARQPASAVDLLLDGEAYRVRPHTARGDVAAAFGSRSYFRSGFSARFPANLLVPGAHELEIRIVTDGGRESFSAMTVRFDVV